ncbi:MAG: glycosyltransferase family 4 protein [Candidatus Omnitrophica bacterium]|nr:glycosyltransferase family 4 protein [Candidatus Omnitrophota bacterium]
MLLYITRKYPPSVGGMQRFNFKLVKHLKARIKLYLISWGGSQMVLPFFLIYALLSGIFICFVKPIRCIYVADGLLSPVGYLLKLITKKPVLVTIHGRDIAYPLAIYQKLLCYSLNRMDKIICVSSKLREECIIRKVSPDKITVIPNGIDPSDFTSKEDALPDGSSSSLLEKITRNKKILLTVGRLVPKKGIHSFIENIFPKILAVRKDIVYVIVGEGPLRNNLLNLIAKLGLQKDVFLCGKINMDNPGLIHIYKKSDVFILPNIRVKDDMEGFGIVALEAGAAGKVVVATNVDGISEAIIEGENGFLMREGDYNGFANKVLNILKNDKECESLGRNSQQFVSRNYSWETISIKYFETIKALTA